MFTEEVNTITRYETFQQNTRHRDSSGFLVALVAILSCIFALSCLVS